jgi:hypothetical protein
MALIVARLDTCPEIKKGVCMLDDLFCNFGVFAGSSVNHPHSQKKKKLQIIDITRWSWSKELELLFLSVHSWSET